ncbi:MAG TPA: hypothetical protein VHW09_29945 [Bryobacteraceae bacterium]|nr:hypothetical protein [Bryobacteraceae bacterium]
MKSKILAASIAALLALALYAQNKILHPEMAVTAGSWDHPAATIGTKPAEPWTDTTVAAGVEHKPEAGKPVSMVGEIVDFSCYIQLGKHGEKHRSCGQKCVQNGQPIGLLTKSGELYMLMPEEHDPRRDGGVDAKTSASEHMGHIVEVNGTEASVGSYHAIYVQGLTK